MLFQITNNKTDNQVTYVARSHATAPFGRKENTIDVSALNDEYYIRVLIYNGKATDSGGAGTGTEKTYKIWLE